MTSNPLTIAGETLTAEDWPEDSQYFEFDVGLDNQWRFMFPDHLNIAPNPYSESISEMEWESLPVKIGDCQPWEIYIVASVARCWFLDKADAIYRNNPSQGFLTLTEIDEKRRANSEIARYLASAAKWARISKGVKT